MGHHIDHVIDIDTVAFCRHPPHPPSPQHLEPPPPPRHGGRTDRLTAAHQLLAHPSKEIRDERHTTTAPAVSRAPASGKPPGRLEGNRNGT